MYMGETLEAIPMATPPTMRHTTNHVNTGAHPVSTLEMANRNAARMRSFLRPRGGLRPPVVVGGYERGRGGRGRGARGRPPRRDGPEQAAEQGATVGPAHQVLAGELEAAFIERLG